jgi:hypothetical protein
MHAKRWIWVVAVATAALAAGACGLFEPRNPEPPITPGTGCRALSDSAAVLLSIEEYYGRTSRETCYNAMIDTSFVFVPDPQDVIEHPGTYDNWDQTVEVKDNAQIASAQKFISVDLLDQYQPTIVSPDQLTQTHFQNYALRFSTSAPDTVTYSGQAELTIHRGSDGQWRITNWVDHRSSSGDPSWGALRADYRTGF